MTPLYTPAMLCAAVALSDYPARPEFSHHAATRSALCGAQIAIDLAVDTARITAVGMSVSACAVGQAAAGIFAGAATGRSHAELRAAADAIALWCADDDAAAPDWPGFEPLLPVRGYPSRHGALLLPWRAALNALDQPADAPTGHQACLTD